MTNIILLGDRDSRFLTHRELDAALEFFPSNFNASWLATDSPSALSIANSADGLWLVPGTPYQNEQVVYDAIEFARTKQQAFLGTCGGFQYAVVEFARNVAGLNDAAHEETEPESSSAIVSRLSCSLVGEERTIQSVPDTKFSSICGLTPFSGYHYCNFGLSDKFIRTLCDYGLTIGATAEDAGTEAIELSDHAFFMATLFQPQMGTQLRGELHPLISQFLAAADS